jgi:phosphatidylglycerol:prolipoprotein diacylglycerol transferase
MHPILFKIPTPWGELPIWSYGVMLGLSMIVAWYTIMYLGQKKEGLSQELMGNTFMVTAVSALTGARLLYILTNLEEFGDFSHWFSFSSGGLVAYGGFLGGLAGSWLYLRAKKVPLLAWADVAAPTLASGLMLTRIGCYLYGCDFGGRLEEGAPSWLVHLGTFPKWVGQNGSPAWAHHVATYDLPVSADASFPVHPTQLYASITGLCLLLFCLWVWQRRRFRGQVILTLTMVYGVFRFLIEYVRDDPERGAAFGFTTSQLISMALVPVCGFIYLQLRRSQGDTQLEPVFPIGAEEDESEENSKKNEDSEENSENSGKSSARKASKAGSRLKKKRKKKK